MTRLLRAILLSFALPPGPAPAQVGIPLCNGLTLVASVSESAGDYEPIIRIDSVTAGAVELTYSAQLAAGSGLAYTLARRAVRQEDLARALAVAPWFAPGAPRTLPGTTAIGPSRAVLRAVKAGDTVAYGVVPRGGSSVQATYRVHRVEAQPVPFAVMVNGERVTLPAVHAAGRYFDETADFYWLDDTDNPLSLATRITSSAGTPALGARIVKITYRCRGAPGGPGGAAADRLERSLRETGRAAVYDIYFDFNSAGIREESDSTLQDIVEVLARHPDWSLAIEGHTDAIGSASANLALSQRRAAAVKTALTVRYGIRAGRLTTAGSGESRPKDRNDTPEGRAQNRRVELVRR